MLWIDDLQWAAPPLLDLLESIARHLVDMPLLVLTTYRREDEGITDWPQSVDPALTLHLPLSPMSDSEVIELANTAAGRTLPNMTVQSISARAGGNPLFITELDVDGHEDDDQLAEYQRLFPLFWQHPAVQGITIWGYRPGMWRTPQGAILAHENGAERAAFRWLLDYVRKSDARFQTVIPALPGTQPVLAPTGRAGGAAGAQ